MSRAQACLLINGHCLSPGAVLPVRSQVFISLDSGRRITRPKAATHPSFVGLSKRALNVRCCSSSPLQLHKPDFQLISTGWSLCAADVLVRSTRDDCGVACIIRNTTFFTSNTSYSLSAELNDTLLLSSFPVMHCMLPQGGFPGVWRLVDVSLCVARVLGYEGYWEK